MHASPGTWGHSGQGLGRGSGPRPLALQVVILTSLGLSFLTHKTGIVTMPASRRCWEDAAPELRGGAPLVRCLLQASPRPAAVSRMGVEKESIDLPCGGEAISLSPCSGTLIE